MENPRDLADITTELEELNSALHALAQAFPNVRPEVFREMLITLSKESRAQVVAEHLLRDGDKWVRGRWRVRQETSLTRATKPKSKILREVQQMEEEQKDTKAIGFGARRRHRKGTLSDTNGNQDDNGPTTLTDDQILRMQGGDAILLEDTFRTPSYRLAVYVALRSEFKSLSKSTIVGVLAEQNHNYTLARPILTDLAAKTWRTSISNMMLRAFGFGIGTSGRPGKNAPPADETHFMLQWAPGTTDERSLRTPTIRWTGDVELDEELNTTVLEPLLDRRRAKEHQISLELAVLLNEHEAELAGAMFECQVCYSDVPFEQIASCSGSGENHFICFECIQRSVTEAVYGQSWDLTIDHGRGRVACIASSATHCDGCVPQDLTERAVLAAKGGSRLWQQLQTRLVEESVSRSGLKIIQCPFCSYSEVDSLYLPSVPLWSLSQSNPIRTLVLLFLGFDFTLFASLLAFLLYVVLYLPLSQFFVLSFTPSMVVEHVRSVWQATLLVNVRRTHLPQRFQCRSPDCYRASCIDCHKAWVDPHRCHESAALSLRTTVEAARTAALKRTCPRCSVSFVKASGCNKMVCVCGYSMCYVCRQGLKGNNRGGANQVRAAGRVGAAAGEEGVGAGADDAGGPAENEDGYRHFCQHFRPTGGRCTECNRCDLYKAEDEDEIVRKAGEAAEREWRARNGFAEDVKLPVATTRDGNVVSSNSGINGRNVSIDFARPSLANLMDWWVSRVLVCRLEKKKEDEDPTAVS